MIDKVIYTAIFGNYEELKQPLVITPGWRYVCFTDQEIESDTWLVIQSKFKEELENSQSVARWFKTMKFEGTQSIWIDASFQINCNLDEFWNKYYQGGVTAPRHPARNCAYREAIICQRRGLDEKQVAKQISRYERERMPMDAGLISSGILMRDNSESVKKFCEIWWNEITNGSNRDQIGFAYCNWKMPGVAHAFSYDYRVRQEFIYSKHYHKR